MTPRRLLTSVAFLVMAGTLATVFVLNRPIEHPVVFAPRSFDFESYNSIESVLDQADTVLIGTVGPVLDRQVDGGGSEDPEAGLPMVLQQIEVKEVSRNTSIPVGGTIVLSSFDNTRIRVDEQSPLKEGLNILLLVVQLPKATVPGIRGFDVIYGRIGADSSVYDLGVDGSVRARDPNVTGLRIADVGKSGGGVPTIAEFRDLVRSKPAKAPIWGPPTK